MFKSTLGFIVILAGLFFTSAKAEIIEAGERQVSVQIPYVLASLEVKCRAPRWEDDRFTTYFSDESYRWIAPYFKQGYTFRLVDRTCGEFGDQELSATSFERVKVLLINASEPRKVLEDNIDDVLELF